MTEFLRGTNDAGPGRGSAGASRRRLVSRIGEEAAFACLGAAQKTHHRENQEHNE